MTTQENTSPTEENKGQQAPTAASTAASSTPTTSSTDASATATSADGTVVEKTDKEIILDDLKKTMHDFGRIPRMLVAPIITYIASKWETIPQERRQHLQRIVHDLKDSGNDGVHKLKDRFGGKHEDTPATATASTTPQDAATNTTSTTSQDDSSASQTKSTSTPSTPETKNTKDIKETKHTVTKEKETKSSPKKITSKRPSPSVKSKK